MTRKQAIEKAINDAWTEIDHAKYPCAIDPTLASIAYDLGRLAGLKEARAGSMRQTYFTHWEWLDGKIEQLMRKLKVE
jgi:hypothetical protein